MRAQLDGVVGMMQGEGSEKIFEDEKPKGGGDDDGDDDDYMFHLRSSANKHAATEVSAPSAARCLQFIT